MHVMSKLLTGSWKNVFETFELEIEPSDALSHAPSNMNAND